MIFVNPYFFKLAIKCYFDRFVLVPIRIRGVVTFVRYHVVVGLRTGHVVFGLTTIRVLETDVKLLCAGLVVVVETVLCIIEHLEDVDGHIAVYSRILK